MYQEQEETDINRPHTTPQSIHLITALYYVLFRVIIHFITSDYFHIMPARLLQKINRLIVSVLVPVYTSRSWEVNGIICPLTGSVKHNLTIAITKGLNYV